MPSFDHPVYVLEVDCQQLELQVRLNDIPILDSNHGKPLTCELPANLQMLDGENILEARFGPPADSEFIHQDASFSVTLVRSFLGETETQCKNITSLNFNIPPTPERGAFANSPGPTELDASALDPASGGAVKIGEINESLDDATRTGVASRSIRLAVPFARWDWPACDEIQDNDATFISLLDEYRHFWTLLNARNPSPVFNFLALKLKAITAAWHMTDEQARDAIEIGDMLRCDEIDLRPLRERGLKLMILGNGKLAKIVDRDGDSPVYFREKDGSLDHYIPLTFCRSRAQWQVAF